MADKTSIEWASNRDGSPGATWNPVTGCSHASPGCTNCYAQVLAGTRLQHHPSRAGLTVMTKAGPVWNGKVRLNEAWLDQPLKWSKPKTIFVCAHGDLFHEDVPDEWIDRVFLRMGQASRHTYIVVTKRAARMRRYICGATIYAGLFTWPLPNVWLLVSAEDQPRLEERVPELLATPAAKRGVSLEPLIGPIDLQSPVYAGPAGVTMQGFLRDPAEPDDFRYHAPKLDWVIVGGESGDSARPMHPHWAREIQVACSSAGVPFFFKQWGSWKPICEMASEEVENLYGPPSKRDPGMKRRCTVPREVLQLDGSRRLEFPPGAMTVFLVGKKAAGRMLDGRTHDARPEIPA